MSDYISQPGEKINGITEGVIWRQLLLFFFPIALGTLFQQLYNTTDAIVVGKYVGKEALAAVGGVTGTLTNLIVGFFVGIASGAGVVLSQFYGAKNDISANQTVHTAYAFAVAGGVILMIIGIAGAPYFLLWMNTPDDVLDYAIPYIRICFSGMIPSMIYNIGTGILHAVGDSKKPLLFLVISCIFNIFLDVFLVAWMEMGVRGAALATVLSQLGSSVMVTVTLMRTRENYQLTLRKIRFHWHILKNILKIGLPAGMEAVFYAISNVLIQAGVNRFGTDIVAGWTAFGKLDNFYWLVVGAFGLSILTFVGQNFGAGKLKRMRKCVLVGFCMTFVASSFIAGFLYFCRVLLVRLFTSEKEVIDIGARIMRQIAPWYLLYVCIEVPSCAIKGTGDTLIPTLFSLFGICVFRVVWVLMIAPAYDNVDFVINCYPLSWALTCLMFIIYYFKGGWLQRQLKRMQIRIE